MHFSSPIIVLHRFFNIVAGGLFLATLNSMPAVADKIKNPTAVFAGLDKITGRTVSFEAAVDEVVQFGSLQLVTRVCYSRPEYEVPQTSAFIEIEEVSTDNQFRRLFDGWVFANSPGLNALEHPVYDIWLTDCKGGKDIIKTPPEIEEEPESTTIPVISEGKKKPKTQSKENSDNTIPLRLPESKSVPPMGSPQQRYFPTNAPTQHKGNGGTYDPGPRN